MARTTRTSTSSNAIPSFKPTKVTLQGKKPIAKLRIPLTELPKLGAAITEALENAQKAGLKPETAKGVINLFAS